jgi:hypothetical protein
MIHECQDCGKDTKDLMTCNDCGKRFCENCYSEKHLACIDCRDKLRTCAICGHRGKSVLYQCGKCGKMYCADCGTYDLGCDECGEEYSRRQVADMQWFGQQTSFLYWLAKPGEEPVAIAECEIAGKTHRASALTIPDAIHKLRADCGEAGTK